MQKNKLIQHIEIIFLQLFTEMLRKDFSSLIRINCSYLILGTEQPKHTVSNKTDRGD